MNYAAVLAMMVSLAFCFPLVVRLGDVLGFGAQPTAVALWGLLFFAVTTALIRLKVDRDRLAADLLTRARQQVTEHPRDPAAYKVEGHHLALLLLRRGHRREAREVIDRYSQLGGAKESEIVALYEALSSAERWRFRPTPPARETVRDRLTAERRTQTEGAEVQAQAEAEAHAAAAPPHGSHS